MMSADKNSLISPETTIGSVTLRVNDVDRVTSFYNQVLGLHILQAEGSVVELGLEPELTLLRLEADPHAPKRQNGTTGLYHFAILLPNRYELAVVLKRLLSKSYPLQGAADHFVSEAIYLADPEGNGIEVYADRPREDWYTPEGQLRMGTVSLDINDLLSTVDQGNSGSPLIPDGTRMGHIHLHVADLQAAIDFYRDVIGFDLMMLYGPSAGFLSAGGYHHHVGVNTWAGVRAPQPDEGSTGLVEYSIILPNQADIELITGRAIEASMEPLRKNGILKTADPSGNSISVKVGE